MGFIYFGTPCTWEVLFQGTIENIKQELLSYVYSVVANTTAINIGKKLGSIKVWQNNLLLKLFMKYTPLNVFPCKQDIFFHAKNFLQGKDLNAYKSDAYSNKIERLS